MGNHSSKMSVQLLRFLAVCGLLSLSMLYGCNDEELNKQAVDDMIKHNVPVGTDKAKVVAFLDDKKIEHSGHTKQNEPVVLAIVRGKPSSSSIVRKAIQIRFDFDQANKLARYSVEEQFTGP
jgi:hypothetical protein